MSNSGEVGRRSKNKGKYGERRVARLLSEFTGKNFRKVPASGGFVKQGSVVAEHIFTGDVICDDSDFLFSVESKNRPRDFSFAQIVAAPSKAPFTEWWYQTLTDADSVDRLPMLFFKASASSNATVGAECVGLCKRGMDRVKYPDDAPKAVFDIYERQVEFKHNGEHIKTTLETCFVVNWRVFVRYVSPDTMFRNL